MKFSAAAAAIFATSLVLVPGADGASTTHGDEQCSVNVCNHTPTTWLKIGAAESEDLHGYEEVGSVEKNHCQMVEHDAPHKLLAVNRNTELLGIYDRNSCGCTFDICGQKVVNHSSRDIEAWIPGGANGLVQDLPAPMLIHPGEWKPVIGGEGEPILIQDPDTKTLFHSFENEGCMQRIVVQEADCVGPDPSPATTSSPRTSVPSTSPSSTPTVAVTKQPVSLRGGDKCEPVCGSLRGCYLFDFNSGAELPLVVESPVDVVASHALSVRCEVDGPIGLVEFAAPDGSVIHGETESPFWMMGSNPDDGAVQHMQPIDMCRSFEFNVRGFMTLDDSQACFNEAFIIESECTDAPTMNPSRAPSPVPSPVPTAAPSDVPTTSPTRSPSSVPTPQPSDKPTDVPSVEPSVAPTEPPTPGPSLRPTSVPSKSPTVSPSSVPTGLPSAMPTISPADRPSTSPSFSPSMIPTSSPSVNPTASPTIQPTEAPTSDPTGGPTEHPTSFPTNSPTGGPSSFPSAIPTLSPTTYPTGSPTDAPSEAPSSQPSVGPTTIPTFGPSIVPTVLPTESPSVSPSATPTATPTEVPTDSPSSNPTASPSGSPTEVPSSQPTSAPSKSPTAKPTWSPSWSPTTLPTDSPSGSPTKVPSSLPTDAPSQAPTTQPTASPSSRPTVVPSVTPTFVPSSSPSTSPSRSPTRIPTTGPTVDPTMRPSTYPTASPTGLPSSVPTIGPSSQPSTSPTEIPTDAPTSSPTGLPSSTPTSGPTNGPTVHPTNTPSGSPSVSPSVLPTSAPSTSPTTASPTESPTCTTMAPTPEPFAAETKAPTETRSGGKESLSPTAAPLPPPTSAPTQPSIRGASPTTAPTTCEVPHHPRMCYLWSSSLRYWDGVAQGTNIDVYTYYGQQFQFESSGLSSSTVPNVPFHQFYSKPFFVRFRNSCGSSYWRLCKNYTPIALDIDHSGSVEHMTGEFKIDITGDGEINDLNEWFAPTEGILIDTSHDIKNGIITGQHLFGDQGGTFADGFEKLEQHDDNGDGMIDGAELDGFMLWTDANSNTILDEGELSTLESHGIVALSTEHKDMVSYALLDDGSKMRMEDLWFSR